MASSSSAVGKIEVADLVDRLVSHRLYAEIHDEEDLRVFMRAHVFCVWDFQSLVKALQGFLTCLEIPWLPTEDPEARRLINEVVLDEESDKGFDGEHLSHFELYLQAMKDCGADTEPIEGFIGDLRQGRSVEEALARPDLPGGVQAFVRHTLELARSGEKHRIAAAFTYGREEIIPAMFRRLVKRLAYRAPARWDRFRYYLRRHIKHDSERHGPMSRAILARLCGEYPRLWGEAEDTARRTLHARLALWDAIREEIRQSSEDDEARRV